MTVCILCRVTVLEDWGPTSPFISIGVPVINKNLYSAISSAPTEMNRAANMHNLCFIYTREFRIPIFLIDGGPSSQTFIDHKVILYPQYGDNFISWYNPFKRCFLNELAPQVVINTSFPGSIAYKTL